MLFIEGKSAKWVAPSLLQEVHYQDFYPKSFDDFRKKYLKISKTSEGLDLYVNFTNYPGDTLDKNPAQNPNRDDPVGHYGYPLKYVIEHPADIWYGAKSKYLRVFKDKSKNKLWLQGLGESQAHAILSKMGIPYEAMEKYRKEFRERVGTGAQKIPRMFWGAFQMDMSGAEPKLKTGQEQTNLLRKAGFDSVEDKGRNEKSAVINPREPEQIVFLDRGAFDIVDVFQLRWEDDTGHVVTNDPGDLGAERKLAAEIARLMGDSLTGDQSDTEGKMGWKHLWTKGDRRIEIQFPRKEDYFKNKTIGQKKHKEVKQSTPHETHIVVKTEFGDFKRNFFDDSKFKDIAAQFYQWWADVKGGEPNPDWKPISKAGDKEQEDRARSAYYDKQAKEETDAALQDLEDWKMVGKLMGLTIRTPEMSNEDAVAWKRYQRLLFLEIKSSFSELDGMTHEQMKSAIESASAKQKATARTDEQEALLDMPWIKEIHSLLLLLASKYPKQDWWRMSHPIQFMRSELERDKG